MFGKLTQFWQVLVARHISAQGSPPQLRSARAPVRARTRGARAIFKALSVNDRVCGRTTFRLGDPVANQQSVRARGHRHRRAIHDIASQNHLCQLVL